MYLCLCFQAIILSKILDKINVKVGFAEHNVSDIKQLNITAKITTTKINDFKESISSMEEKLKSINNDTINKEGTV